MKIPSVAVFGASKKIALCRAGAFTLIDVLIATTVLTVVILLVSQIINMTGNTVNSQRQMLDVDGQARMVFDRMATDFASMIRRPDFDNSAYSYNKQFKMTGNDCFFFFSEAPGYYGGAAANMEGSYAVTGYRIWNGGDNPSVNDPKPFWMDRVGKGMIWDTVGKSGRINLTFDSAGKPLTITTLRGRSTDVTPRTAPGTGDPFHVLGNQVFRLEFCFLMKEKQADGAFYSVSPDDKKAFSDVAAVVATSAILDETNRNRIPEGQFVAAMKATVAALKDGDTPDVANDWNTALMDALKSGNAAIPRVVAANTRVYQRYFFSR